VFSDDHGVAFYAYLEDVAVLPFQCVYDGLGYGHSEAINIASELNFQCERHEQRIYNVRFIYKCILWINIEFTLYIPLWLKTNAKLLLRIIGYSIALVGTGHWIIWFWLMMNSAEPNHMVVWVFGHSTGEVILFAEFLLAIYATAWIILELVNIARNKK